MFILKKLIRIFSEDNFLWPSDSVAFVISVALLKSDIRRVLVRLSKEQTVRDCRSARIETKSLYGLQMHIRISDDVRRLPRPLLFINGASLIYKELLVIRIGRGGFICGFIFGWLDFMRIPWRTLGSINETTMSRVTWSVFMDKTQYSVKKEECFVKRGKVYKRRKQL